MNEIDTMKASEIAIAERKAGISIATINDPNYPKTNLFIALGWVVAKRSNPSLTFEEFGDTHTLNEVMKVLGLELPEDEEGN